MHIILDTDFGDDIDDTFALYYLLQLAGDDLSLILTAFGQTQMRAELVAAFLKKCGWSDVPIAVGKADPAYREPYLYRFYQPEDHPGFLEDGLQAAKALIEAYDDVVILALGPTTNLAALLDLCPKAAQVPVYAMFGSIRRGYFGKEGPDREWNVFADIPSAKAFLAGYRKLYLSPLDSCGLLQFAGQDYEALLASENPVLADYRKWLTLGFHQDPEKSSVQYDVQPVYALFDGARLQYEPLPLACDDEGYVRVRPEGHPVRCAMEWADLDGFLRELRDVYL